MRHMAFFWGWGQPLELVQDFPVGAPNIVAANKHLEGGNCYKKKGALDDV